MRGRGAAVTDTPPAGSVLSPCGREEVKAAEQEQQRADDWSRTPVVLEAERRGSRGARQLDDGRDAQAEAGEAEAHQQDGELSHGRFRIRWSVTRRLGVVGKAPGGLADLDGMALLVLSQKEQ